MDPALRDALLRGIAAWSGITPPNAIAEHAIEDLAAAMLGFAQLRGRLAFEDEPASFEAALQATKDRDA
jgi:hypothetical protein